MDIQENIKVVGMQNSIFVVDDEMYELYKAFINHKRIECGPAAASIFYQLGRIHGIQQEGSRRKAGAK